MSKGKNLPQEGKWANQLATEKYGVAGQKICILPPHVYIFSAFARWREEKKILQRGEKNKLRGKIWYGIAGEIQWEQWNKIYEL